MPKGNGKDWRPDEPRLRYALARPMYGPPHPGHARTSLQNVLVADRRGYHYTADITPMGTHLHAARNSIVKQLLRDEKLQQHIDGLVWMDSDIVFFEGGHLAKFLEGVKAQGAHLAAGCYYTKGLSCRPTWGKISTEPDSNGFFEIKWQAGPGLQGWERIPKGGCGFGLTWTSIELLQWLGPGDSTLDSGLGPFSKLPHWAEPGDDYSFCDRVAASGNSAFDLWVCHDVQLGHAGMDGVKTQDHFVQQQLNKHSKAQDISQPQKEAI